MNLLLNADVPPEPWLIDLMILCIFLYEFGESIKGNELVFYCHRKLTHCCVHIHGTTEVSKCCDIYLYCVRVLILYCINSLTLSVSEKLKELDRKVKTVKMEAFAPNTRKTRESQWKCYEDFCDEFKLNLFPVTPETVCPFPSGSQVPYVM